MDCDELQILKLEYMCDTKLCKAKCCYNPPIPKEFIELYADKIINAIQTEVFLGDSPFGKNNIIPITQSNKCPFLRDDNICNIYEIRPMICVKFGDTIKCQLYDFPIK